jgi:hypothetical protein
MIVQVIFQNEVIDEVIELKSLESLSNLSEVAKTNNSPSVLKIEILDAYLAEKIML